jgi:hypothetical protein
MHVHYIVFFLYSFLLHERRRERRGVENLKKKSYKRRARVYIFVAGKRANELKAPKV